MFRKIIKGLKDVWCGTLEFDTEPKKGSFNPVTSGGVYEAINGAAGAKEIVYFDVDPSDPPSGIYAAITEALSNNKEPVIKNDGTVYFYSSTSTGNYIFVGGYGADEVKYTTITISSDDSIVEKTVDVLEGTYFPLYYHSEGQEFTVADKTGHALTKTEIADAYRAGQIFMFSSYPASNTQAHWGYCCDINIDSDNTGYAEFFILSAFGGDSYSWEKYRINLSSNTEFVTLWGPNTSHSTGYSGRYANASDVAALQSQVSSLSASIVPEYTEQDYPANSYVMHDGILYTNPNAIATAEAWNPAHWTQTTVASMTTEMIVENMSCLINVGTIDISTGTATVQNNRNSAATVSTTTVELICSPDEGFACNFAIKLIASVNSTIRVTKRAGNVDIQLGYATAGGNTVTAGKAYQLTCVGDFWTLAEFSVPTP